MLNVLLLTSQPIDPFVRIVLILVGLVLAWVLIKLLLRLAIKVFTCGCGVIVLIGVVMIAAELLSKRGGP